MGLSLSRAIFFVALALFLAPVTFVVYAQGDVRLLNADHPTLGRLLGRMQRGGKQVLLYENGEIVADQPADTSPPPSVRPSAPAAPATPHAPAPTPAPEPTPVPAPTPIAASEPPPTVTAIPAPAPTTPASPPPPARETPAPPLQPLPYALPTLDDYDPWAIPDAPPDAIGPDEAPHPALSTDPSIAQTEAEAEAVATPFVVQLADPDSGARYQAKQALVRIGVAAVLPVMDALRQPGQPDHVYKAAADVLGELRDPRAVALLCEQLIAEHFNARIEAATALGKIGDPAAAPALLQAIAAAEYSPQLRTAAYKALGDTGSKVAIRPLMRALRLDLYPDCQSEAAAALDRITGQTFGMNNIKRTAWLREYHPDWLEAGPDTVVNKSYLGIIKLFTAGVLIASGVGILLVRR